MTDDYRVPLKEHIESRLTALEQATTIAAHAMDKRLDGMNEFREALKDQASRMATRQEVEDKMAAVERDLRELREFRNMMRGKADQQAVNLALALSVLGMAISIILHFI